MPETQCNDDALDPQMATPPPAHERLFARAAQVRARLEAHRQALEEQELRAQEEARRRPKMGWVSADARPWQREQQHRRQRQREQQRQRRLFLRSNASRRSDAGAAEARLRMRRGGRCQARPRAGRRHLSAASHQRQRRSSVFAVVARAPRMRPEARDQGGSIGGPAAGAGAGRARRLHFHAALQPQLQQQQQQLHVLRP